MAKNVQPLFITSVMLLTTLLSSVITSGCDDRQSDRRILNDVIEYVEENNGKDDSVKLTDWELSSNKNDDARYLDSVYLNYSGSYDLLQQDKYLEWICGYANAKGGTLYIGIDDNGEVFFRVQSWGKAYYLKYNEMFGIGNSVYIAD